MIQPPSGARVARRLALMSRLSRGLDRLVSGFTLAVAWMALPSLIVLTLFHVAGRQFRDVSSEALAQGEVDLFFAFVMLSFGYAYLRDGHVRVDVFRDRMGGTCTAWIEIFGCLAILVPLSCLLMFRGAASTWLSFAQGERSGFLADLPYEWLIKASVPFGFTLLLLAGLCVVLRNALFLMGTEAAQAPQADEDLALFLTLGDRRAPEEPG